MPMRVQSVVLGYKAVIKLGLLNENPLAALRLLRFSNLINPFKRLILK